MFILVCGATPCGGSRRSVFLVGMDHARRWTMRLQVSHLRQIARRFPGRWADGGRKSTVARWMRRCAATEYAPIRDLTNYSSILLAINLSMKKIILILLM